MRKATNFLVLLVVAAVALTVAGCGKSDPNAAARKRLVGKWAAEPEPKADSNDADVVVLDEEDDEIGFDFKDDGTLSMEMGLPVPIKGTWQVARAEGDQVTVKTVEEFPTISFSSHTDMQGKEIQKEETKFEKEEGEYSIVFKGDNQIVITPKAGDGEGPNEPLTLDRKR